MKLTTVAGFLAVTLAALCVSPVWSAPAPEPEAEPEPLPEPAALASLEPAPVASLEPAPVASIEPKPTSLALPEGDDAALIDVLALVGVDLSGLGDLLNRLLGAILGIAEGDKCDYPKHAANIEGILADICVYVDLLGIKIKVQVLLILGPLLEAVAQLLQNLLGGLLCDLSIVVNLLLNILLTLNLELDVGVALRLGKLLNLDVLALVNLG